MSVAERAQIKRATLAARRALETLDDVGREELARIYGAAAESLRATIERSGDNAGKVTVDALRSVLAQVEGILDGVAVTRDAVVTAGITQAAQTGAAGAGLESAAAMRVATTAVDFVRHFVAQDGLMLSERLWRVDRGAREEITRAVESAVVQGHGSAQAARVERSAERLWQAAPAAWRPEGSELHNLLRWAARRSGWASCLPR